MMGIRIKNYISDILSVLLSTSFGILAHTAFVSDDFLVAMTVSFIFILPAGIGALAIWPYRHDPTLNWTKSIIRPWVPCILFMLVIVTFELEAWGCIILAAPIVFTLASLGGAAMYAITNSGEKATNLSLIILLTSPFALAPIEGQMDSPTRATLTQTSIHIEATPAEVWAQIGAVPDITVEVQSPRLFNLVGIPRPIKAEMGEIELGAVRIASFENGLQFREVVTEVTYERSVTYSIEMINHDLLPEPLHQIDGEYLDLKSASYRIEPQSDGTVILYLISEHTLTTQFNGYGAIWTHLIMTDFQNNLLDVIKLRAESVTE